MSDAQQPVKHTVLITDRYSTEALAHLERNPNFLIKKTETFPKPEDLKIATALLIRSRTKVDKELLGQAPNLKLIITATSGYDHIDLKSCAERGVRVMYTPNANTEGAAELTLMLMLGVLRRLGEVQKQFSAGKWKDGCPTGHELRSKTVGIIGLGRVGSRVAELLKSFNSHVVAFDPYQDDAVFARLGVERVGLTEVLAQADIVTMHVPLTKETRRMIRLETIELMQEGVIFINTSRGQVVDESGLVSALETQQIAACGLDVFEHEPLAKESRLRGMPQVLMTPHIGAYTEEAYQKASVEAVQKLLLYCAEDSVSDELLP